MARPRGHQINPSAFEDFLRLTGKSLSEVADSAEVPRPTLSAIVGRHNRASGPVATKIAEALDVQPSTLFPTLSLRFLENDSEAAA